MPQLADIDTANIGEEEHSPEDVERVRDILKKHQPILLQGSNALPPAARGIICDIDVQGAKPIAQRARRVPPHLLPQLYQVLKDLLEAGVIEFSTSEWASPIVIVLKKDGKTIRLCVDYRRVNMLVKLLGFPLPIIDDMLIGLDKYLWFLSLDMASGFWAVPLTKRASEISAFVCPLGHFQWTRMPFGFKNAPLIYQILLNNCLWGFVRLPPHEEDEVDSEVLNYLGLTNTAEDRTQFPPRTDENGEKLTVFDYNRPFPPHVKPVLDRTSYIDDVGFGAEFWDAVCKKLDQLLYWLRYWNISVGLPKCEVGKYVVGFLSHMISREGIQAKPKILKTIKDLQFPQTLKEVQSLPS